ncbi:unnamed protein product [Cylicocyclus nassatus]|uniref:ABC transporter family G domain-containing protein n=1 Tax=Cylicocyclus nassatus TaxID=53992 RepID=A0AA36HBM0_CYLNA|nr:unnamed protein product [Cylicocyclus nassatus]
MAVVEANPFSPIYSRPQKQMATKNQANEEDKILAIYKNLDMSEESCVAREYDVVYGTGATSKLLKSSVSESCILQNVMHADPIKIGTGKRNMEERKRISDNLSAIDSQLHNSTTSSACSEELNQFGYRSYKQERREENCESPCLAISHLSYSVDQRKSWERLMLRMPKRQFLIRDVSFQLWAGDIMAVLSASAYVTKEELSQPLTVIQYLTIHAAIHPPATKHLRIKEMIEQLLTTLGLAPRRHKLCSTLSRSEATRLRIAAQLLKDTDILVCDNLTKDMDVYETAFIIDYLRDWAIKLNRMVIMCIAPTSFDLLLMFSKCILLTSGRVVYSDCPSKMLNYFESIGYACPAYKNPCDYYVDVVTHDHLSQAASEESLARICKLVQLWEQNKSCSPRSTNSDLPVNASLCRPSVLKTLIALYRQSYYKFINAPILSLWEPFTALIVSLIISFSFNSLTKEKRVGASDRVGFTVAVLYFGLIPWIYAVIQKVAYEKQDIRNFLRETQLSTIIFLIYKLFCDFPTIMLTSTLYTVPFLLLIEFNMSNTQQCLWMASLLCIIFTHLYLWRFITQAFSFLFDSATVAFVTTGSIACS